MHSENQANLRVHNIRNTIECTIRRPHENVAELSRERPVQQRNVEIPVQKQILGRGKIVVTYSLKLKKCGKSMMEKKTEGLERRENANSRK